MNSKAKKIDHPFSPVPLGTGSRPIRVRKDRRGTNIEDYLSHPQTSARVGGHVFQPNVVIAFLAIILSAIVFRLGYLQLIRGDEFRMASEYNRIRIETLLAPRGIIVDRRGRALLENTPNFTLYVIPADLPGNPVERAAISQRLLEAFPALGSGIVEVLKNAPRGSLTPVILSDHVDYRQALRLSTIIARLPGVDLQVSGTRVYPQGATMAHLLGYLGKPSPEELKARPDLSPLTEVGRMGIELYYDQLLRGRDGQREVERDHLNKELAVIARRDPVPGKNLVLTIDRDLQAMVHNVLTKTIADGKYPGAAAVAMNPRDGSILALVSVPSFDPNTFVRRTDQQTIQNILNDHSQPLFFRAVGGTYPSGSTIKPAIAAAGLSERVITDRTIITSTGGLRVGPNTFPDWKSGGHGSTDVRKALAESVNTFFYYLGGGYEDFAGLGVDRIVTYLQRFGLGAPLGVDLPNESAGFIPTAEWRHRPDAQRWYLGDTYHLSIGQGYINVTPLQIANYTAAIANGGTLYRPHVVAAIQSTDGTTEGTTEPVVITRAVTADIAEIVRSGMRQAVVSGSARGLSGLPVTVAAKTGTAEFGSKEKTHAWLTVFGPYEDPEIVLAVIVEEGGEGSTTSLQAARQILQHYFGQKPPP